MSITNAEWWLMGVMVVVALAVGVAIVVVVRILRARCPACRKPTLELDLRDHPGGLVAGSTSAMMFRCQSCSAEFRREDNGPLISKDAWDRGAREELPRAKVHR